MKKNKGKLVVLGIYVFFVFIFPLVSLVTYSPSKIVGLAQSLVPKSADEFFRSYILLLKPEDTTQAYSLLTDDVRQAVATSSFKEVSKYFASTTDQVMVVGANVNKIFGDGVRTNYDITYEIQNDDQVNKYILLNLVAYETEGGIKILGIHTQPETESITSQNGFNTGPFGVYLILSILFPLFITYTAFRYIQKATNPRWWLFLLILFASLYIYLQNDGGFTFNLGFHSLMGKDGIWGPWTFDLPIPIAAIAYYFMRKKLEGQNIVATSTKPETDLTTISTK